MDRSEALKQLKAQDAHTRLLAARVLATEAEPEDEAILRTALQRETVTWTRKAIRSAIETLSRTSEAPVQASEEPPEDALTAASDIHAMAVEETTRRLLHEIEPILGALRIAGANEVNNYSDSESHRLHERLDALLQAVASLSKAAALAKPREFDLGELLYRSSEDEAGHLPVQLERSGMRPLLVMGDPFLVDLAFRNGLRNALEATGQLPEEQRRPVIVAWGDTDKDAWVAVLDRGVGPPAAIHRVWEIGSTTKRRHLGMGLAIAKAAVSSMGGTITLIPREDGGARFEFRWPAYRGDVDEPAAR